MLISAYHTTQLISYIGNKRRLLGFIDKALQPIIADLGSDSLRIFDGFAGTGCVSRLLKGYASELFVNDLEPYSYTVNQCYLANKSEIDLAWLEDAVSYLNAHKLSSRKRGIIARHYAPKDDANIKLGERVFYTTRNARIIDNIRVMIRDEYEDNPLLIAPLLTAASIHTNTSGVFRGFHKNRQGVGQFGGEKRVSVARIIEDITLKVPIFSDYECTLYFTQEDVNRVVKMVNDLDIAYYDPPYNQHSYGANYFMLNVINDYQEPNIVENSVSGIVKNWQRSAYNKAREAEAAMEALVADTDAKYLLISYNDEGIIPVDRFHTLLAKYGKVTVVEQDYNTFGGCRNMGKEKTLKDGTVKNRKVKEMLWTVRR